MVADLSRDMTGSGTVKSSAYKIPRGLYLGPSHLNGIIGSALQYCQGENFWAWQKLNIELVDPCTIFLA